ncbi:MAG: molybdate ABC transporter substrate-binding protein [Verrucomicrobiota bacterium]
MYKAKAIFLGIVILALVLVAGLVWRGGSGKDGLDEPLVMFCAAGIRAPVEAIAAAYEEEYGVPVQLQFGGSGTLLSSLKVSNADIYLAADTSYTDLAKEEGLLAETMEVSYLTAGLGVPKGNPKGVKSLEDLKREDLKVGLANPEAASVGKFTKKVLSEHGVWDGVDAEVMTPTVNELANSLKLGTIDVAVVWDALAEQYEEIDFVSVPEFDVEKKTITVGVLKAAPHPTAALTFCRFLTSRDRGLPVFAAEGYEVPEDADVWEETPELLLFSGAMLRPALQETVTAFEEREGVRITPVYNGCGILVAQMKAGEQPDAYFSCDIKFMDMVEERFMESKTVSANDMVILAEKGNPKGITELKDLVKPGLRIGFAHPEKSALGDLTKSLLEDEGLYQDIVDSGNLVLDSPTGDFLVNQAKTGSLDAVIVYRSNAQADPGTVESLDIIDIDRPKAVAHQPWAIGKHSDHKRLLERFYESAVSPESKEQFLSFGFRWELED